MAEQLVTTLSPEENEEALRLYAAHRCHADRLTSDMDVMERANDARRTVREALDSGKSFNDIDHQTAVFANGEVTQRRMLYHAQLQYNAHMWETYQFKEKNLDKFLAQAALEDRERSRNREDITSE
jgi:hypothetical protein